MPSVIVLLFICLVSIADATATQSRFMTSSYLSLLASSLILLLPVQLTSSLAFQRLAAWIRVVRLWKLTFTSFAFEGLNVVGVENLNVI